MNFYSIKDLRIETKRICENIRQNGEAVITNNGKPSVLMLDISENNFEEILRAVRQAKAMIAFNSMRATAAQKMLLALKGGGFLDCCFRYQCNCFRPLDSQRQSRLYR